MRKSNSRAETISGQSEGDALAPAVLSSVLTGLVPPALGGDGELRLCDLNAEVAAGLDEARRDALRTLIRRTVQDRLARLPSEVLAHPLPAPALALRRLKLEWRTSDCLHRLLPLLPSDNVWTVQRYLTVSKFRASSLIELLTAVERDTAAGNVQKKSELVALATTAATTATASASPENEDLALARALRELTSQLPLSESHAEAALQTIGFFGNNASISDLVQRAEARGLVVPFRLVRQQSSALLVATEQVPGVIAIYAAAVRCVQHWGLTRVKEIVERVRVIHRYTIDNRVARAVLAGLPQFSWLDQKLGWFWFRDSPNRLVRAVGKVFSVKQKVSLEGLRRAVFRSYERHQRPGIRVIHNVCAQIPGCRLEGEWVVMDGPLSREEWLSPTELTLVDIVEHHGGVAPLSALRLAAKSFGISVATLRRTIRESPVLQIFEGSLLLVA